MKDDGATHRPPQPPRGAAPAGAGFRTVTVPMAVYARLERWRDALLAQGVDALPERLRAPVRAAFARADGKHKGVVGLGALLAAAFEAFFPDDDDGAPRPPERPHEEADDDGRDD